MKKILFAVFVSAIGTTFLIPNEKEQQNTFREIGGFEYRDFMNFTELRAIVNTSAGQFHGDRIKTIERVENWARGKQENELRSLLEQMDFVPACIPEKQGILNALSEKQNDSSAIR